MSDATRPLPRHQCRRHPWAWVAVAEVQGSDKPRVCNHCRDDGLSAAEATMELLTAEPEPTKPARINLPMLCAATKCDDAAALIRQAERSGERGDDAIREAREYLAAADELLVWLLSDRKTPCSLKEPKA